MSVLDLGRNAPERRSNYKINKYIKAVRLITPHQTRYKRRFQFQQCTMLIPVTTSATSTLNIAGFSPNTVCVCAVRLFEHTTFISLNPRLIFIEGVNYVVIRWERKFCDTSLMVARAPGMLGGLIYVVTVVISRPCRQDTLIHVVTVETRRICIFYYFNTCTVHSLLFVIQPTKARIIINI